LSTVTEVRYVIVCVWRGGGSDNRVVHRSPFPGSCMDSVGLCPQSTADPLDPGAQLNPLLDLQETSWLTPSVIVQGKRFRTDRGCGKHKSKTWRVEETRFTLKYLCKSQFQTNSCPPVSFNLQISTLHQAATREKSTIPSQPYRPK